MWETVVDGLEGVGGGWWLIGAAAAVGLVKGARPLAKGAIKGYMAVRDGLTRCTSGARQGMRGIYDEGVREYERSEQPGAAEPHEALAEAELPAAAPRRSRARRAPTPA